MQDTIDWVGKMPALSREAAALVVSIHDVSPLTRRVVDQMLGDLGAVGVGVTSLLVVPDHHRKGHFREDPDFCRWISGLHAEGNEVVMHGYFHLRDRAGNAGIWERIVTERYTSGEGEFYDLCGRDALARVDRGLREFRGVGIDPTGFIAPAWLLGREATAAVRAAGFGYTTRIGTVEDLKTGAIHRSQSLVYSVRAAWRRWMSLRWNSFLHARLSTAPLMRLGLHPPDWQHPEIREHALNCIVRALAGRRAMTYDGWLQQQRSF